MPSRFTTLDVAAAKDTARTMIVNANLRQGKPASDHYLGLFFAAINAEIDARANDPNAMSLLPDNFDQIAIAYAARARGNQNFLESRDARQQQRRIARAPSPVL